MNYLYGAIVIATVLGIIGFILHKRNPPKKVRLLDNMPGDNEKRHARSKKIWDEANVGDILLITFHSSPKQKAMAKALVSDVDFVRIIDSHLETYNPNDESHKGVVSQQWKTIAKKIRDNPDLMKNLDPSYHAIMQEVASWSPWEKHQLKEKVVAEVPKRPGETMPTEFFERMFDIPKVVKATTTSIHLVREG